MSEQNKTKWLHVRLTEQEFNQFNAAFRKTVGITRSEFARKMLLAKPVVAGYRNKSLDDFMPVLMQLQKDLNGIGNNFNQAVHKLHMIDHFPAYKVWYQAWESDRKILLERIEDLRVRFNKMADAWLQ